MSLTHYYTLGRSSLRVSRLALGTMTFGTEWGWGSDQENAREIFQRYVDAGGNFIDTADVYTKGSSETWLGEFMAERGNRDRLVVATKFSHPSEPRNPNARRMLGMALFDRGDFDGAAAQAREGVALAPNDAAMRDLLARASAGRRTGR